MSEQQNFKDSIWVFRIPSQTPHFVKTKKDHDYTPDTLLTYNYVTKYWGFRANVSSIYEMLREVFGKKEFEAYDPKYVRHYELQSWLIDRQKEFQDGEPVDFTEIYEALMTAGEFMRSERADFELGNVEERLWGIFLAIIDPTNKMKIND